MEQNDLIVGQLMDQGYDYEDIIKAMIGASDTNDIMKNLNKRRSHPVQDYQNLASSQISNMSRNSEPQIRDGFKLSEADEKGVSSSQILKKDNELDDHGFKSLLDFCGKESMMVVKNAEPLMDLKSVEYTVETYRNA